MSSYIIKEEFVYFSARNLQNIYSECFLYSNSLVLYRLSDNSNKHSFAYSTGTVVKTVRVSIFF